MNNRQRNARTDTHREAAGGDAAAERLHSRRTVLTGAAMGVGMAAAAVGAVAAASPADAADRPHEQLGAGRTTAPSRKVSNGVDSSADFTVQGTASFSDVVSFARSGVLSITRGRTSMVHSGVALTATSLVIASLQNHLPGVYVESVVPNVAGSSFQVFLSKKVPSGKTANVAWFVVN